MVEHRRSPQHSHTNTEFRTPNSSKPLSAQNHIDTEIKGRQPFASVPAIIATHVPLALPARVSSVLAVSRDPRGGIWVVPRETDGATVAFLLSKKGSSSRTWNLAVSSGTVRNVAVAPDGTLAVTFGAGDTSPPNGITDVATITSCGQASASNVPGDVGAVSFGGDGALWLPLSWDTTPWNLPSSARVRPLRR